MCIRPLKMSRNTRVRILIGIKIDNKTIRVALMDGGRSLEKTRLVAVLVVLNASSLVVRLRPLVVLNRATPLAGLVPFTSKTECDHQIILLKYSWNN